MRLDRKRLVEELQQFVLGGNGIIVGRPGVGKTFLLKSYCRSLLDAGVPCLFLPIDKLGANSEADLRAELGIQTDLAGYLRSQERPSEHPPTLVIDAFDAARSELAQRFVLGLVRGVREALGDRWRVVVSVRVYDAQSLWRFRNCSPRQRIRRDHSKTLVFHAGTLQFRSFLKTKLRKWSEPLPTSRQSMQRLIPSSEHSCEFPSTCG